MKSFNKTITVEVTVDSIANKLLAMMNPDEKHSDLVVETIIGSAIALPKQGDLLLSNLYNSLNGYTNEIDFEIGEQVKCEYEVYTYQRTENDTYSRRNRVIGDCTIEQLDIYSDRKIKVSYECLNSKGENIVETQWVKHTQCNKLPKKGKIVINKEPV